MAKDKDNSKTFNLKPSESNLLRFTHEHQQAIFSGILSTVAMDRLGYAVSEHTKFELNGDFTKIKLSELEPPKGESPVKAA